MIKFIKLRIKSHTSLKKPVEINEYKKICIKGIRINTHPKNINNFLFLLILFSLLFGKILFERLKLYFTYKPEFRVEKSNIFDAISSLRGGSKADVAIYLGIF